MFDESENTPMEARGRVNDEPANNTLDVGDDDHLDVGDDDHLDVGDDDHLDVDVDIDMADVVQLKYDVPGLRRFLDVVFHTDLAEDQEIFVQLSKDAPKGFGSIPKRLIRDGLAKSHTPMKGYFSTSTLRPIDGLMRHTKEAFVAFHVLVLDDIGSKIPWEKIPEDLVENYRIESSADNFQLGYVLAEPITDYEEAQLLIDLFVDAGLTDGGGAMPVKKVRLPCGVNGKKGDKGKFHVRLVGELYVDPWDVQELLDAAGIEVEWETYRKEARKPNARVRRLGASAWNPELHYINPQTGIIDPVLEWMYSQNRVIQDGQRAFMDVICPFHDEHSEQDLHAQLCGYSPLGHGLYPHARKFHCFHDSCKTRDQDDFLDQIFLLGGPHMPAKEYTPELATQYVFDMSTGTDVYDVKREGRPLLSKLSALKAVTPKGRVGKNMVCTVGLWLRQPTTVKVHGSVYDPTQRGKLVRAPGGELRVNNFHAPTWALKTPDMDKIQPFLDHMEFLLPNPDEHDYVMQWLAAKVQHPPFRGAAIIMVAEEQGVGRGLLAQIIERLWTDENVTNIEQGELLGDKPSQFNEHMESSYLIINENLADESVRDQKKAHDRMKDIIDPATSARYVNAKYGAKRKSRLNYSTLMFTQQFNAMHVPYYENARRLYVATNPSHTHPGGMEGYYNPLIEWVTAGGWEADLWSYLMGLDVDLPYMNGPAPETAGMVAMKQHSTRGADYLADAMVAMWPYDLFPPAPKFDDALMAAAQAAGIAPDKDGSYTTFKAAFKRALWRASTSTLNDGTKAVNQRYGPGKTDTLTPRVRKGSEACESAHKFSVFCEKEKANGWKTEVLALHGIQPSSDFIQSVAEDALKRAQ